jgi:DNA-binding XRE family transcriptional regulator
LTALKDRKLFEQGKLLGWGGVVWNDELDVSSETVYKYGKNVSKEYDDIDSVVLGYKIKVKRTMRLMTQEELAKKIGIDQSDLSTIEKGTANPSL